MAEIQAYKAPMAEYFNVICDIILNKNNNAKLTNLDQEKVRGAIRQHLDKFERGETVTQYYIQKLSEFTKIQQDGLEGKTGIEYLKQNIINWKDYKLFLGAFTPLVVYLDSFKLQGEKTSSHNIGYQHFKSNFKQDIADKLNQYLFDQLDEERKGVGIPQQTQTLITEIISLYYQLDLQGIVRLIEKGTFNRQKTWKATEYDFFSDPNADQKLFGYQNNPNLQQNQQQQQLQQQQQQQKQHQYYIDNFEMKMLKNLTQIYENKKKQDWVKPTPEFVNLALKAIKEEEDRAKQYYHYSLNEVQEILKKILILEPAQQLVIHESGVQSMLEKKKSDELDKIYQLFSKIPLKQQQQQQQGQQQQQQQTTHPFNYMAEVYQKYIKDRLGEIKKKQEDERKEEEKKAQEKKEEQKAQGGAAPVQKKSQAIVAAEFIQYVLDIKIESDQLIQNVFGNHSIFQKARDNSFRTFLNEDQIYSRFLAMKCDIDFRKGVKEMKSDQIEELQCQIINLYNYLNYKDVFLKDYAKLFQLRNIRPGISQNQEAEKQLITKLKTETGSTQAIMQLQKMIIDLSEDVKNDFNQFQLQRKIKPQQFIQNYKFLLLTNGCWDVNLNYKLELPDKIQPLAKQFEDYYKSKYPERTIVWIVNESIIEVYSEANTFSKTFNFVLTLEQYILLNCIERNKNQVTVDQLVKLTKINEQSLYFQLFCMWNQKLLTRSNPPKDKAQIDKFNDPNEIISINLKGYQSTQRLINLSSIKPKQAEAAVPTGDDPEIMQQRNNVIDSSIVRIMKARKQLPLPQIIDETTRMIELFRSQPKLIKKRIESLQERGYLKRDDNDQTLYIYIP